MSPSFLAVRQTFDSSLATIKKPAEAFPPDMTKNPARSVADLGGSIMSALQMPMDLMNAGVAEATNFLSDMWPKFPVAHFGSLYVGLPHGHAHPPSFGIPLPSIGIVLLGTYLKVLVGGLPAARADDLGIAPTCCGLAPFFEIKLGSSKVFIGGARAARVTDLCLPCTVDPMKGLDLMQIAGMALQVVNIAADITDAVNDSGAPKGDQAQPQATQDDSTASAAPENAVTALKESSASLSAQIAAAQPDSDDGAGEAGPDSNLAGAHALSAAMDAAQLAADAAAMAVRMMMGTDPAVPPLPGFLVTGVPNVVVAGIPLPTLPDPLQALFKALKNKVKKMRAKPGERAEHQNSEKVGGCATCKR